tara:strand:+ start:160 stop:540 length:381 start_codon:yes stop_codon:yes gene_type:complete
MSNISIKGIILGVIAILVIDIISGIAMIPIFASNMSEESIEKIFLETGPLIYSLILGTLSTVIGGFIAANIGRQAAYKNAAILGVIGLFFGVLMSEGLPLWFNIIGFVTVIPASLIGGYFAIRKNA